jgi:hypothetical protein
MGAAWSGRDVVGRVAVLHALHACLEAGGEVARGVVGVGWVVVIVVGRVGILSGVVQRGYSNTWLLSANGHLI